MTFDDLTLDELRALLRQARWQQLFVEIGRCDILVYESPTNVVTDFLAHHRVRPASIQAVAGDLDRYTRLDRSTVERYIAVLLQRELAYDTRRLPADVARRAATLFLTPFGPETTFHLSITLSLDALIAREQERSVGCGVWSGMFGSTFEEGIVALDLDGVVGALFVGDED